MSARKATRRPKAQKSTSLALDGTVGALFAYVASMRPMRDVADVEGRDEYQRGRSLIQRMGLSAHGDEMPTLKLSRADAADVLYFMHYSEPVEPQGWWDDPSDGPSHYLGYNIVLQMVERSIRKRGMSA